LQSDRRTPLDKEGPWSPSRIDANDEDRPARIKRNSDDLRLPGRLNPVVTGADYLGGDCVWIHSHEAIRPDSVRHANKDQTTVGIRHCRHGVNDSRGVRLFVFEGEALWEVLLHQVPHSRLGDIGCRRQEKRVSRHHQSSIALS
jgi:hypothetical protein